MNQKPLTFPDRTSRPAFAMVEAIVATLVVALMVAGALAAVAASRVIQTKASDRARGQLLATELMSEILEQQYMQSGSLLLGPDFGETTRASFNDVDDYNGWVETPPQNFDGTTIANLTGWKRAVTVAWVNAADPTTVSLIESGAKRITVTVSRNGLVVATRVAVKVNAP